MALSDLDPAGFELLMGATVEAVKVA